MQVKYKVNVNDKAILNKRTLDRIDNELDKRKFLRNILRIVVIGIILVIVIYLIVSGRKEGMRIAENYDNLKANLKDSKRSFDRRVKLFEKDADGNIILTDTTLSSLAEAAQEEVVGTPASTPVNGAGTFKPVKDGNISIEGVSTNVSASNGDSQIPTYTGIPKEWAATDAEYITVEESVNAWRAWYKQEFGHDYPYKVGTVIHQERKRGNYYHTHNTTIVEQTNGVPTLNRVKCFTIAPPPFWTTNEFRHTCVADPGCYEYKYLAIMKEKNGENKVYVPMYAADAKGHTWPGGLLQTSIGHGSDSYDMSDGSNHIYDDTGDGSYFNANLMNDPTAAMNEAISEFEDASWWDKWKGTTGYADKFVRRDEDNRATSQAPFCIELVTPLGSPDVVQSFGLYDYEIYGIVRCKLKDGDI